jgi:ABC-type nickel/cobalt efflux system permease component RcnA
LCKREKGDVMAMTGILLIGVILCGLVLLATFSLGLIMLLIKMGVIVREAQKPPHLDAGDYRLDQGREAISEDRRH